jgi:hypothetical protein
MNSLDDIVLPSIALAVIGLAVSASVSAFNPGASTREVVQLEPVTVVAKRLTVSDPLACVNDKRAPAQGSNT